MTTTRRSMPRCTRLEERTQPSAWGFDPTFAGKGQHVLSLPVQVTHAEANAVERLPDGSYIVVGSALDSAGHSAIAVSRWDANGRLTGFGKRLFTFPDLGYTDAFAKGVTLDEQGRLLIVGGVTNASAADWIVLRMLPEGTLDPTFGGKGRLVVDWLTDTDEAAVDVIVDPTKRITILGTSANAQETNLLRIDENGFIDFSFGSLGRVSFSGVGDPVALVRSGVGVIVAADQQNTTRDAHIFRVLPNGSFDPTFSTRIDSGTDDFSGGLAVTGDAVYLVGASKSSGSATLIAKLDLDGNPYSTFNGGSGLLVSQPFAGYTTAGSAVGVDASGRILVTGTATATSTGVQSPFVIHLSASGSLLSQSLLHTGRHHSTAAAFIGADNSDVVLVGSANTLTGEQFAGVRAVQDFPSGGFRLSSSFGGNGVALTPFHYAVTARVEIAAAAVDPVGNLLLGGALIVENTIDSVLLRFRSDGSLDGGFGQAGVARLDLASVGGPIVPGPGLSDDRITGLTLLPNGRFAVTAFSVGGIGRDNFLTAVFTQFGSLDPSFNGTGFAVFDAGGGVDHATGIVSSSHHTFTVVGRMDIGGRPHFGSIRYSIAGPIDLSYGTNGMASVFVSPDLSQRVASVVRRSDGSIVLGGEADNRFAVVAFDAQGSILAPPLLFGTGNADRTDSLVLGADGLVYLLGRSTYLDGSSEIVVARFDPRSGLDSSFGPNASGQIRFRVFPSATIESPVGGVLAPDGSLFIGGRSGSAEASQFIAFSVTKEGLVETTSLLRTEFSASLNHALAAIGSNGGTRFFLIGSSANDLAVAAFRRSTPVSPPPIVPPIVPPTIPPVVPPTLPPVVPPPQIPRPIGTGRYFGNIILNTTSGEGNIVSIFDPRVGVILESFLAYPVLPGERLYGVNAAIGDVTGDGIADLVLGAGPGGGPHVRVFDGVTGADIGSYFAYDSNFRGGVYVAVGDTDGDGRNEIITGAGEGALNTPDGVRLNLLAGGPHIRRVIYGGSVDAFIDLGSFFAFEEYLRCGVRVAVADVDGDGIDDIVAATGPGDAFGPVFGSIPRMRLYQGGSLKLLWEQLVGPTDYLGGVFVTAGDIDGKRNADGRLQAEIAMTYNRNGPSVVRLLHADGSLRNESAVPASRVPMIFPYGISPVIRDSNRDGLGELFVGIGEDDVASIYLLDSETLGLARPRFPTVPETYLGVYLG